MAKGRLLNTTITESMKFHQLPDDTCRLLATWTISLLDKFGVFHADPTLVKSRVFPMRVDVTVEQVQRYLDDMERVGLIVRFVHDGRAYQFWPGFEDNQPHLHQDRERSTFPTPPNMAPKAESITPADASSAQTGDVDQLRTNSGLIPEVVHPNIRETNLIQGNVIQGRGADAPPAPTQLNIPDALKNQPAPPRKPRTPKFSPTNITESDDPRVQSYLEIVRDEITTTNADAIRERVALEHLQAWRDVLIIYALEERPATRFTWMFERYDNKVNAARVKATQPQAVKQATAPARNGKRDTFRRPQVIYTDAERKAREEAARLRLAARQAERQRATV